MTIKLWNVAILADEAYNTCEVVHGNSKPYTYAYNTNVHTLLVGNKVVVENARGFAVGEVITIHEEPEIDTEADFYYSLVVCKVPTDAHERRVQALRDFTQQLSRQRRRALQQQALEALGVSTTRCATIDHDTTED